MYSMRTKVINKTGLHARPVAEFVRESKKYSSNITIAKIDTVDNTQCQEADAKSIIMILSLGIGNGEEIEIAAEGEDEKEAVNALIALVDSGLGE